MWLFHSRLFEILIHTQIYSGYIINFTIAKNYPRLYFITSFVKVKQHRLCLISSTDTAVI